jgi:hypothetical protein
VASRTIAGMSERAATRVLLAGASICLFTAIWWWAFPDPTPVGPFFGIPVPLFFLLIAAWLLLMARFPKLRGPLR